MGETTPTTPFQKSSCERINWHPLFITHWLLGGLNRTRVSLVLNQESDTRAQAKPISSEFVDLGDGIEAEVQISESGTHIKPRTRAIINKHYSIRAYQGGVLKGSMKGTFNGSTFTPDASSATKMILEPGSYNFVCYNDKFQEVGNNLELNINDAKEAYICQTTQEIYVYTAQQHITFNMRHACSRIEVFLECYGKLSSGTTASVTPVGTSAKTKLVYVGATNSFTQTAGSISPSTLTFSGAELTGTNVFGAVTADKKIYLLPGTDFTKLQMKFTGGTFGKNRNMSDAPAMLSRRKSTQSEGHATLPRRKSTQNEGHAMLPRIKSTQSEGHVVFPKIKSGKNEAHVASKDIRITLG